ncbi:MAG TPA: response regulator [Candidatus Dormibacteraeota bacterium]|nr:response regulator [Candidatus Dormibacteraeota bacterium]
MVRDVLIVDDHRGFRREAKRLMEQIGFRVVGDAGTGSEAIDKVRQLNPDVVLLDIQLPDLDGFAVATALASLPEPPAVLLVSTRDAVDYGSRLSNCSAVGFIAKAELTADSLLALLGSR